MVMCTFGFLVYGVYGLIVCWLTYNSYVSAKLYETCFTPLLACCDCGLGLLVLFNAGWLLLVGFVGVCGCVGFWVCRVCFLIDFRWLLFAWWLMCLLYDCT